MRGTAAPAPDRTVEMMECQLKHLVRLVDDLLDVGRITSGKLQLCAQRATLRARKGGWESAWPWFTGWYSWSLAGPRSELSPHLELV